jgi:hypothetical protein
MEKLIQHELEVFDRNAQCTQRLLLNAGVELVRWYGNLAFRTKYMLYDTLSPISLRLLHFPQ